MASGAVIKRFGTANVTFVSCFMIAIALLGFYFAPSIVWLFLFAIPLGLGAGAVDAGLNNYVATHYKAHHMNWGITIGRFISGFITMVVSNRNLIRIGQIMALSGVLLLLLPLPSYFSLGGFILIGLGFAPIFPAMIHETPTRFGKEHSQAIIGYQMAVAYTGSTLIPPLLGFIASHTTIGIFPFFIVIFVVAMLLSSERLNALIKRRDFLKT